ncbi:unnamed protein product [Clavelina lepadiformis]|uniref:Uncharacterized protein n=1 Tax=Clavelina lepadiformis TaxID=159417 RepID=A0ABP0G1Y9_CLALP
MEDVRTFLRGGVAQMVERALSMREVPGSIPGTSKKHFTDFRLNLTENGYKIALIFEEATGFEFVELNPGPHTCEACALPLSYIPSRRGWDSNPRVQSTRGLAVHRLNHSATSSR